LGNTVHPGIAKKRKKEQSGLMASRKSPRQLLWTIVRIVVPIGLISWLLARMDWKTVWPLLRHMPGWTLAVSAVLFALSEAVTAFRWYYLLRFQGMKVSFPRLVGLVFVGIFASNFLPTTIGGDVVKIAGIVQGPEKRALAATSVLADRLYNLLGMALLLPLALLVRGIPQVHSTQGMLFPIIAVAGLPAWSKLRIRIVQTWKDVRRWFTSPGCVLTALALSWLSIAMAFGAFWVITIGMDIRISYWQASAISLITYFIALIPISINGFGIQEGSRTYLLTLMGALPVQATAAAFLIRLVTMGVSLLGGVRLLWGWRDLLKGRQAPAPEISGDQGD
jgi:uncharacterized membrane protein YbhN (UPF0104 family)